MKNSFLIMNNWAVALAGMPEHSTSELIKLICRYHIDGEVKPSEDMTANALFESWKPMMDANIEAYKLSTKKRSEAGKKGMEKRWHNKVITHNNNVITPNNNVIASYNTTITNDNTSITNDNDTVTVTVTDTDTDKDINNIPPYIPPRGRETPDSIIDTSDLDEVTKQNVKTWVSYKQEQFRFKYKPTGLKALITEIKNKETALGADGVEKAINLSMAKGYKGIIWDLVSGQQTSPYMQAIRDRVNVVDSWVIGDANDG